MCPCVCFFQIMISTKSSWNECVTMSWFTRKKVRAVRVCVLLCVFVLCASVELSAILQTFILFRQFIRHFDICPGSFAQQTEQRRFVGTKWSFQLHQCLDVLHEITTSWGSELKLCVRAETKCLGQWIFHASSLNCRFSLSDPDGQDKTERSKQWTLF